MGLFGFNYSKPGPGVDKDAPKKKGIFLFFELFFRKFWKLIQANMLYFICSIPMLLIVYFASPFLVSPLIEMLRAGGIEEEMLTMTSSALTVFFTVTIVSFLGSGPASAAFAYILRCFTREQHSWILSDFKEKFKENFKQGIIVSIVDILLLVLGYVAIMFYSSMAVNNLYGMGRLWTFLQVFLCMLLVIYMFMHFYIYQLMVTFENSMKQLYKNAAVFALAFLPMNILLGGIFFVLNYLLFSTVTPPFAVILAFVLWFGIIRFPIEFYAARTIQRRVLDQQAKPEEDRSDKE